MTEDPVRRRIEALGSRLSLPTVRRALGALEGEHSSDRTGGSDAMLGARPYVYGDEARLIDWKASARLGRPMVAERERLATSRTWLLLDAGREMTGASESGEPVHRVAANALRMFAALSLRRSDDVSLVLGDAASITRMPFHGGFAEFEHALDRALERDWTKGRDVGALLGYARRIRDRRCLLVLATDERALGEDEMRAIGLLASTHPLIVIDVATLNPFSSAFPVEDGRTGRRVPAFLRSSRAAADVAAHRAWRAAALERSLARTGSRLIHAGSSEAMFDAFVAVVSRSLAVSGRPSSLAEAMTP